MAIRVAVGGTPDAEVMIDVSQEEVCVVEPAELLMINVAGGVLQRTVLVSVTVDCWLRAG